MSQVTAMFPRRSVLSVRGMFLVVLVASAFVPAFSTRTAYSAENKEQGRRWFKRGQELFVEGRYLEAAHAFETGYAAAPRTAFLINIAHSYRRAGELEKAKTYYEKLLELEPNTPQRGEVEANLKSIDDALTLNSLPAAPTQAPLAPAPDPALAVRPQEEEESVVLQAEPAPTHRVEEGGNTSILGKTWFWALVVAAAAGTAVATYALTRDAGGCREDLCLSERP